MSVCRRHALLTSFIVRILPGVIEGKHCCRMNIDLPTEFLLEVQVFFCSTRLVSRLVDFNFVVCMEKKNYKSTTKRLEGKPNIISDACYSFYSLHSKLSARHATQLASVQKRSLIYKMQLK